MNKNILLIALAPKDLYRNPLIPGCKQFFCGPDAACEGNNKNTEALKLDLNSMTGSELMNHLNIYGFRPELTFVKADATCRNHLRGIDKLPGKKILLMGDTHHMNKPIQKMLSYAHNETWDLISSEHDRHHLGLFRKSGLRNLIWLPCFTMNPHDLAPKSEVKNEAIFVGSLSRHHRYRRHVLERIGANKVKVCIASAPQETAAKLYNNHSVSLNVSLNGDLNFRIMEVLAAGGCLVTDRLGPDSGLHELLREGDHYLGYTPEEAAEKIRWLQENPSDRNSIAMAGYSHFWQTFSPKQQSSALISALYKSKIPSIFRCPQ